MQPSGFIYGKDRVGFSVPRDSGERRMAKSAAYPFFKAILLLFFVLWLVEGEAVADLYRYKDENGHWVITDVPPEGVHNMETTKDGGGRPSRSSRFRDLQKDLTERYHPQSPIEAASLSTVTIQTSMGLGSGFFINEQGYILTNKHVLRGDEAQIKETEAMISREDDKIKDQEAIINDNENQLKRLKNSLDDFKASIDRIADPGAKTVATRNYEERVAQYDLYEAQLRKRKTEFEEKVSKYRQRKEDFLRKSATAQKDRTFTVVLKDKAELQAHLVSISDRQDLALLKVEGCKSPYIASGADNRLVQGMRVFAIGSPLGVGDSVASGVLSGYDNDYIRTDAKIYFGNSGGPLLTADGKVIGINTLKRITQTFEGIGFAIPVKKALQEFKSDLRSGP